MALCKNVDFLRVIIGDFRLLWHVILLGDMLELLYLEFNVQILYVF